MFKVAIREILARKRRLVTTSIAVVIGIAFLTGTQLLSGVLNDSIATLVASSFDGIDAATRSAQVQETGFGQPLRAPVPASLVDDVKAVDGVAAAEGIVNSETAQLVGTDGKVVGGGFGPPTHVNNWRSDEDLQLGTLKDGREPTSDDEMVLDFKSAQDGGYAIGDKVSVSSQTGIETFTLVGTIGLGPTAERASNVKELIFTTPTAQRLAQIPDQFDLVASKADSGVSQEQLAERISEALPDVQTITGDELIKETQDQISQFVDILTTFVTVFGVIALVVACFIIYNTFSIIVAQRSRETALLRAVGAKRRQVLGATILEALAIGLVASVIGLGLGVLLAAGLKAAVGSFLSVEGGLPSLTFSVVVLALVVGLVVTMVSAVFPAYRATRVPPIAAMTEVSLDRSDVSRARLWIGLVLLIVGVGAIALGLGGIGTALVEVGFGAFLVLLTVSLVLGPLIAAPASRLLAAPFSLGGRITGRLAGENAARNPRRTAATAAALTIGVTLVTLIAVLASSIRESVNEQISAYNADFIVNSNSFSFNNGIPASTADAIRDLDDVKAASPVRFAPIRLLDPVSKANQSTSTSSTNALGAADSAPAGKDEFVLGIDPTTYFQVVNSGEIQGSIDDLSGEHSIAVQKDYADDHGFHVGSKVPVYFAQTGVMELDVALIFGQGFGQSDLYLPLSTFEPNVLPGFNVDNLIYVQATDDADLASLRKQLDEITKDSPSIEVQDLQEFADNQTAPFDTFLAIVYGLLGLAIIIALIGIANTLSLSILERTRELGLLRAVGMSRSQLRRSVRIEAAIIAVFGTLIGLVIGVALSGILSIAIAADNPDIFKFTLPVGQLVIIAIVAALAGIIAAILPARRAARLDVLTAISSQ